MPPAADGAALTTLTITGSAITGNVAAPTSTVVSPHGASCGPIVICPFAHAGGGGIDSWGNLTLRHSLVSGNQASGPLTSDANGGGIYSQDGRLTVDHTVVTRNRALAGIPDGRFAEGAGIMVDTFFSPDGTCVSPRPLCRLVLRDSVVKGNASRLTTNLPLFASDGNFVLLANGGGVHVGDNIPTIVERSAISHNAAISRDPLGEAGSIDAGIIVGASPLTMRDSEVNRNLTKTTALTVADVSPVGSAVEVDGSGTIVNTKIDRNVATTFSPGGTASTDGALSVFDTDLLTVKNSTISKNVTLAAATPARPRSWAAPCPTTRRSFSITSWSWATWLGPRVPRHRPGGRHLERQPDSRASALTLKTPESSETRSRRAPASRAMVAACSRRSRSPG